MSRHTRWPSELARLGHPPLGLPTALVLGLALVTCAAIPPDSESDADSTTVDSPSSAPEPPPSPGGLCGGLVQDRQPRPMRPLLKPDLGQAIRDPDFGTLIRRITAVSASEGDNAIIKPAYGTVQAWNADESLLILWHRGRGHELYDGRTYQFIRPLELVSPSDIEQFLWDPTNPDVLYYPSKYNAIPNLMLYRVSTGQSEVLRRFEFCPTDWGRTLSLGSDPMYLSWGPDRKVIGLMCGEEKFLYDVVSRRVLGRTRVPTANAPQPGPDGRLAYLDGRVYDEHLEVHLTLPLANPYEHASIGKSVRSGHPVYNAVVFDPPAGGSDETDVGNLVRFDMATGERRVIIGMATGFPYPPGGTHISAIAHRNPGWVAVSMVGDPRGRDLLHNEILIANVDTGGFCRLAHHRSFAGEGRWGYWAEPHVVISPTGTRLLFGSDWGNGPTVDSYVIELPVYSSP